MRSRKHNWLKFILLFFTVSVSMCAINGGSVIQSYDMFGQVVSSYAYEQQETDIISRNNHQNRFQNKSEVNQYNSWFVILCIIFIIISLNFVLTLSPYDTIVSLKVRMDN